MVDYPTPQASQVLRTPLPTVTSVRQQTHRSGSSSSAVSAESFATLIQKLDYLDPVDLKRVREAYRFADEAHLGQFRASKEPYITHPIAVAGLCADWKLDVQAIMAALMHDAMEDCGVTKVELIERFGAPTADLVDGLTKLDKLQFSTREESQAESFRKMFLAMARDVRVILIKLADRLHNMRTMDAMVQHKKTRIARETLDIYAAIAHRLGLNQTYRELQELSFKYLRPWRYTALSKAVQKARGYRRDIVDQIQLDVEKALKQAKLNYKVKGREKTLYSIYQKMLEKHMSFAHVSDVFGFRIVLETMPDCYLTLGVLHQLFKPIPGRFKDYIAIPKANGYQSLHTTLVSPLGTAMEFQIRTESMHTFAEKGIAAHWLYKSSPSNGISQAQEAQRLGAMWLQSLLDIQNETHDATEFLEHIKIDLFPEAVYVFTPKSKILALPRGATPIDFAYAIHSDVGDHCVAAKINGEPVALRAELRSGDVVEIHTAPGAKPNPTWINFARTGRARSKIRHYLKTLEQEESQNLGEKMLAQALRAEGLNLPSVEETHTTIWQHVTRWSGNRSRDELLTDIGLGRKMASIVAKRLAHVMAEHGTKPDALTLTRGNYAAATDAGLVLIDGTESGSIQMADCCRPIPGDAIAGYLGRGEGLLVHTTECSVAKRLFERDSERWTHLAWSEQPARAFETRVSLLLANAKGALAQVATAVAGAEADITHIDMGAEPSAQSTEMKLLLAVRDRLHLAEVIRALKRAHTVLRVSRLKSS
jgi:GTP diphosphokinase / guanosine-3',5'-bis(diphosphate) 3'-diphosphatase